MNKHVVKFENNSGTVKAGYDEISPITGNKSVFVEGIDTETYEKVCIESGYHSSSHYHKTNPEISKIEEQFPDLIRDSRIEDDNGFYWYLSSMNLGSVMLYPEPDSVDEYCWTVMPISMKDPDPNSDETMQFVLDEKNATYYSRENFEHAFARLYEVYADKKQLS